MTSELRTGARFGPYLLGERLGRGGMGVVHAATAPDGTPVALKRLTTSEDDVSRQGVQRFLDEAKLGATLVHPNVVRTFDGGVIDGQPYLVMERLSGGTLGELFELPTDGLELSLALGIIDQLLSALDYLHEHDVIHRDLKPSNVFLTTDGMVKLIDFGIALAGAADTTATATGLLRGSLPFLSPEYVRGETPDARSDLYSVGLVLHELLCGKRVFAQSNHAALLSAILFNPVVPVRSQGADVPLAIDDELQRVLSRDPAARHASARELQQALRDASDAGAAPREALATWVALRKREVSQHTARVQASVAAAPPATPPATPQVPASAAPPRARSPLRWAFLSVAVVTVLGAVGVALRPPGPAEPPQIQPPAKVASREVTGEVDAGLTPVREADAGASAQVATAPARVGSHKPEKPRRKLGKITIDSQPNWATISIDGKHVGPTPVFRHSLEIGEHRVDAVTEAGLRATRRVKVTLDEEVRVSFEW